MDWVADIRGICSLIRTKWHVNQWLGASAAAPPHMWKEQASPSVSCYPPGETVGRRDRPRIGAVCPFVRLVSGGGDHITGDRPRPDPVWETACCCIPPAPTAFLHTFLARVETTMTPSKDAFPEPCPPAPTVPQPSVLRPSSSLQLYNPHAAGIDIGEAEHGVAVPPDRSPQPVRRFGTFTADLDTLADWLLDCGITTVAMESTGVYWIPLFELLEARGLQVMLIDPRQAKRAPGRPKTDRLDCQWLQRLHADGLLAAAFRPSDQIGVLRSSLRHRQMLLTYGAHHMQHMQKA